MTDTTTTTAPALNRRALLSRALAGAAGAAIGATAAIPSTKAAIGTDPILALDAERRRLDDANAQADDAAGARRDSLPRAAWKDDAELAALNQASDDFRRATMAVEDQIFAAVPVSAAGAVVQLRLLMWVADLEDVSLYNQAFNNVISWIEGDAA